LKDYIETRERETRTRKRNASQAINKEEKTDVKQSTETKHKRGSLKRQRRIGRENDYY
jgi:hypothetical protein